VLPRHGFRAVTMLTITRRLLAAEIHGNISRKEEVVLGKPEIAFPRKLMSWQRWKGSGRKRKSSETRRVRSSKKGTSY